MSRTHPRRTNAQFTRMLIACVIFAASILFILLSNTTAHAKGPQCAGKIKTGEQCSRSAGKGAAYCFQHNPQTARCGVTTKAGTACKRTVKTAGTHCSQHTK